MSKRKIQTMEELSEAIGVSRPTLSRYFQDPASVRGSTRRRILEGLERVDYTPNFFATRMNRKTKGLIGVILPYLNDLFFTSLLEAIEIAAIDADWTMITQSSHGDPALEARAIKKLLSMKADGAIVAPLGRSRSVEALERLGANLPCLFVDSRLPEPLPGVDFVGTNHRQSIGLMVEYLCRTGAPPIFLGMPNSTSNGVERERAYRLQMEALGHRPEVVETDIPLGGCDFEAFGHDVMDAHFARGVHTEATILCANDRLAIGALRAANRHGLFRRSPEAASGLRIAGHDDHPLSRYMTPALTTVAQDTTAIGGAAVQMLMRRVKSGDVVSDVVEKTFDAVLKVRESA